jgi:Zn-dependent protease
VSNVNFVEILTYIVILIFSVMVHEIAHALAALWKGDDTAKQMGRITLNPVPHLDLFGSIILPALMIISNMHFLFAWAKPVPIHPEKFRDPKKDIPLVAFAGPAANLILALISAIIIKIFNIWHPSGYIGISQDIVMFLFIMINVNICLAIINLIPIPPLDGSKVVTIFMSWRTASKFLSLNPYICFIVLIGLLWTGILGRIIFPIVSVLIKGLLSI